MLSCRGYFVLKSSGFSCPHRSKPYISKNFKPIENFEYARNGNSNGGAGGIRRSYTTGFGSNGKASSNSGGGSNNIFSPYKKVDFRKLYNVGGNYGDGNEEDGGDDIGEEDGGYEGGGHGGGHDGGHGGGRGGGHGGYERGHDGHGRGPGNGENNEGNDGYVNYGTRYDDAIDKFSRGKGGVNKQWFGLRDDDDEGRRGWTPEIRRVRQIITNHPSRQTVCQMLNFQI